MANIYAPPLITLVELYWIPHNRASLSIKDYKLQHLPMDLVDKQGIFSFNSCFICCCECSSALSIPLSLFLASSSQNVSQTILYICCWEIQIIFVTGSSRRFNLQLPCLYQIRGFVVFNISSRRTWLKFF